MGDQFVHTYTLHTCFRFHSPCSYLVYTLQAHVRFKIFKFSREIHFFIHALHTCFMVHSPNSYLVFTLQAHVTFKIFKFSGEIIFSYLHSPHIFQCSLSIQLFGLHSPSTCQVQDFQIFKGVHFFILTLSTHVSVFTLHTFFHAYTLQACSSVKSLAKCYYNFIMCFIKCPSV